jgi:hypothetical protein
VVLRLALLLLLCLLLWFLLFCVALFVVAVVLLWAHPALPHRFARYWVLNAPAAVVARLLW